MKKHHRREITLGIAMALSLTGSYAFATPVHEDNSIVTDNEVKSARTVEFAHETLDNQEDQPETQKQLDLHATKNDDENESRAVIAPPPEENITHNLGETVITARRRAEPLATVPANVSVITAQDLQKRNAFSVRDALAREAGIYVSPTQETNNGISLRGFTGENVLVNVNGQPMNNAFDGRVNWDAIPMDDIERIEVVRGSGSALYGAHAVGGVINIILKRPQNEGIHGESYASYGSDSTIKRGLNITGGDGHRLGFRLGYQKNTTSGWPGKFVSVSPSVSPVKNPNASLLPVTGNFPRTADNRYIVGSPGAEERQSETTTFAMNYDFGHRRNLEYSYLHNDYHYSYHDPFSYMHNAQGEVFSGYAPVPNGFLNVNYSNFFKTIGERKQDMHNLRYQDHAANFKAALSYSNTYSDGYTSASNPTSINWNGAGTRALYPSKSYHFDVEKKWNIKNNTLLGGLAWDRSEMTYRSFNLTHWRDFNSIYGAPKIENGGKLRTWALFLQDEIRLDKKWKAGLGLRWDRFDKEDGFSSFSGQRQNYADRSFHAFSPKVSLGYEPERNSLIYVSYGKSFNPPAIYRLYRDTSSNEANPDLVPEKSQTYEIGAKRMRGKSAYGLSLYRTKTKDKIAYVTRRGQRAIYLNQDQGLVKGTEMYWNQNFGKGWSGYLNYTFQSAELTSDGQSRRDWTIPKHMVHFGVEKDNGKLNSILDAEYISARQRPDSIEGTYNSEDAFFLTNLFFNYKPTKDWKVQFGISNLFDRKFYASEAARGRSYALDLTYSF